MKSYKAWLETITLLVLLICLWILFAPIQLGGQAAYLLIQGNSMEPLFYKGDLVIIRKSSQYQVGDIVGYRNEDLRNFVFHRIIGQELDRFILKGDNNSWDDSYQPTSSDVIGIFWIHLPQAGKVMEWIRQPIILALATGLIGGFIMMGMVTEQPKQKKKMKKSSINFVEAIPMLLLILGLLTIASYILVLFAFIQPLDKIVSYDHPFQHNGTFFYSAMAPPGIYDSTTLHEGQPIFPKLSCTINLGFGYTVSGDQLYDLIGTYQLTIEVLEEQSGWRRSFALQPISTFGGSMFVTGAELNLCQLETLVDEFEKQTEIKPAFYSLAVIPNVTVTGKVNDQELLESFNPRMVFKFDKLHFFLTREDPEVDPLNPYKNGILKTYGKMENSISLVGLTIPIPGLRIIAFLTFIFSLIGLIILGLYAYQTGKHSQESLIRMKYGSFLVDVHQEGTDVSAGMVNIASMDELAKLAERNNTMIFHEKRGTSHYYFLKADGTTYCYAIANGN
ncbi:MAG: signal peptidase I [Pelolinea sp.]|nr:signal peptidase I [Pelolinea sp.]